MDFTAAPTLVGSLARLEQLAPEHTDDLVAAVADGELWKTWYTHVPAPDAVAADVEQRLANQAAGTTAAWAIRRSDTGSVCGVTTFMNLAPEHRRLEIGSTWLARSSHGTGVNADAKLLLLGRAFDDLGCNVVEFRTHWHNQQSRAAIARLGAKQDGVLRNHQVWDDGSLRDTVVFSIIATEWPAVRTGLTARVARHAASGR
jgi:RimJ/RimL family protein N-acetyltransferase